MSHVDIIAQLIDEAMVGARSSPMAANVAAYLHELLNGADADVQLGNLNGNVIDLMVNQNGARHNYRVTVEYSGSEQPDTR